MLYLLYGDDRFSLKNKVNNIIQLLQKKQPNSILVNVEKGVDEIANIVKTNNLFGEKFIVYVDVENGEQLDEVVRFKKEMQESNNVFIIFAGINEEAEKELEKYAKSVENKFIPKELKKETKIFGITDIFIQKDKIKTWKKYIDLISSGVTPEEIHGVLFWQLKTLDLSNDVTTQQGIKPFILKKLKASKFSPSEAKEGLVQLIDLWDKSHKKSNTLETSLERFILNVCR